MDFNRRTVLTMTAASVTVAGCLGEQGDGDETMPQDDEAGTDDGDGADDASGNDDSEEVTVQVRSNSEFDEILVGPDEMTVYNFDMDTQGATESTCYDDCADAWPPLTVEDAPAAGPDVAAELTTFERDDGEMQVVANGWPLYYFANDEEPGDTAGQGVNDVWWVLRADGTPVRPEDDPGDNGDGTADGDDGDGENDDGTEDDSGGSDGPGGSY